MRHPAGTHSLDASRLPPFPCQPILTGTLTQPCRIPHGILTRGLYFCFLWQQFQLARIGMDADNEPNTHFDTESRAAPANLGACVTGLVNAVARGMAQIVAPHGLTHIDFALLRLFLGVEEWTTTQLAQTLPLAPSGISRSVTKLVEMGLVQRRRLISDRRVVILTLTEEGLSLTQDLHRRVQAFDSWLCEGVSAEEMAVFASVSSRVMANHAALEQWPMR